MNSLKKFIAKRTRQLRKEKGLSQEKLAEISDLPVTYISKVENTRVNIQIETLEKIIKGLDCTYEEFFNMPKFTDNNNFHDFICNFEKLSSEQQNNILEAFNILIRGIK